MSNGVEVIVAGDKSTLPGDPSILRILPSSIYKPYTLAASTLQNNVVMMLPSEPDVSLSLSLPLSHSSFLLCNSIVNVFLFYFSLIAKRCITIVDSKSIRYEDMFNHIHLSNNLYARRQNQN